MDMIKQNLPTSMWKVRELVDKATNVVMNYTETEAKVREATNDDPWGPSGTQMADLARLTFMYEHFAEICGSGTGMLWKRMLQEGKKNWRRTYKSLLLLDYLIKHGSERVITTTREHLYDMRSLEHYTHIDEKGKDQGINVRQRAKDLLALINDDSNLREERKKAKKNRDKYIGVSSEGGGRWGGSSSGTGWNDSPSSGGYKDLDEPSGGGNTWDWDEGVREVHSDHEDHSGPQNIPEIPTKNGADDADWADFDNFRNKPKEAQNPASSFTAPVSAQTNQKKSSVPSRKIDLGAAASWTTPAGTSLPKSASHDLFSVSDAAPIPESRSVDLFGNAFGAPTPSSVPPQNIQAQPAQPAGGSFWDDSAAAPSQVTSAPQTTAPQVTAPQVDLFASAPAPSQPSGPPPGAQFDLLGAMSNTSAPIMSQSVSNEPPKNVAPKEVGSTWSKNKGNVNIDLTNLGRPQQQTKAPSMNQLSGNSTPQASPAMTPMMGGMSPMMANPAVMSTPNMMGFNQQAQMGGFNQQTQMGGFNPQAQQMGFQQMNSQFNPQMQQMTQQMGNINFNNQNKNNNLGNLL